MRVKYYVEEGAGHLRRALHLRGIELAPVK